MIYLGTTPNQHILPMLCWLLQQQVPEIYHIGSNYVWFWKMDRITREAIILASGSVVRSKLLPLGDENVDALIAVIIACRPNVILNTMLGKSAYSFYRARNWACQQQPWLNEVLKLSLTLCEPEVQLIGAEALEGYLVSVSWFQSIDSAANRRFLYSNRQRFGEHVSPSVDSESAGWLDICWRGLLRATGMLTLKASAMPYCRTKWIRQPGGFVSTPTIITAG